LEKLKLIGCVISVTVMFRSKRNPFVNQANIGGYVNTPSPPDSMFMYVVDRGDTLRSFGNDARTKSDNRITSKQFPVGWLFFSTQNIEHIKSHFRQRQPGVGFGDIQATMLKYYEAMGLEENIHNSETDRIKRKVQQINERVVLAYTQLLDGLVRGQYTYSRYLRQPHRPGTYNRLGQDTNIRDRSVIANLGYYQGIEDKLKQAKPFNPVEYTQLNAAARDVHFVQRM
jgi:hypothetical protein